MARAGATTAVVGGGLALGAGLFVAYKSLRNQIKESIGLDLPGKKAVEEIVKENEKGIPQFLRDVPKGKGPIAAFRRRLNIQALRARQRDAAERGKRAGVIAGAFTNAINFLNPFAIFGGA